MDTEFWKSLSVQRKIMKNYLRNGRSNIESWDRYLASFRRFFCAIDDLAHSHTSLLRELKDLPLIMGSVIVGSIFVFLINAALDVARVYLDPRAR